MPSSASPTPEHSFETALARLELLVAEMESDKMPLEQLLLAYEEGTKLVKICQAKLTDAEKKIEMIQRRTNADPELKAFEPAAKSDASPARAAAKDASLF